MLRDLLALAATKTSQKRRLVLQRISDLFLDGAENFVDDDVVLIARIFPELVGGWALADSTRSRSNAPTIPPVPAGTDALPVDVLHSDTLTLDRLAEALSRVDPTAGERVRRLTLSDPPTAIALLDHAAALLTETRRRRHTDAADAAALATLVRERVRRLDGCLDDLCDAARPTAVAFLLADLADLDPTHVANVVARPDDLGIALICRHLDVGEESYRRLCRLRRRETGRPPEAEEAMLADYARVDRAAADRVLRFHRVRGSLLGD